MGNLPGFFRSGPHGRFAGFPAWQIANLLLSFKAMEILFLISLTIIGLCLLLVVVRVVLLYCRLALWYAEDSLNALSEGVRESSDRAGYAFHKRVRQRAFFRWFDAKVGGHIHTGGVNNESLEAHRHTPVLRRLIQEELPS